jgi:thiol-disulfide isomerase/thioredoxin
MKKCLFFVTVLSLIVSCTGKKEGFIINGQIQGFTDGKVTLQRRLDNNFITIDSTVIKNGEFSLKGKINDPQVCYIWLNDTLPPIRILVENVKYDLWADINKLDKPSIKGSPLQAKLDEYHALTQPYEDQLDSLYTLVRSARKEGNTQLSDSMEKNYDAVEKEERVVSKDFVGKNSNNIVGPYIMWGTLIYDLELQEMMNMASAFSPSIDSSQYVKLIQAHIATLKKVAVGEMFTEITMPDTIGNNISLSSFKGKIVLVDFWASWCGPCRRENPKVVALYKDYSKKGFEIFGVSFDENGDKWKKAIRDDKLSWIHVSDLKGWQSEGSKLYGVRSIPHTVLLDRDGRIVAKNLQGDDLKKAIDQLVNKKPS